MQMIEMSLATTEVIRWLTILGLDKQWHESVYLSFQWHWFNKNYYY